MIYRTEKRLRNILRKRMFRLGLPLVLAVLVVVYGLIAFLIAQGVTKADRDPQEDIQLQPCV